MPALTDVVRGVGEVAQADSHVSRDWAGDSHRKGDAEDRVREGERVKVTVMEKELAGRETPDEGDYSQDGVGQMGEREDDRGRQRGGALASRQAQQALEEEVLQQDLLEECPEGVAEIAVKKREQTAGP